MTPPGLYLQLFSIHGLIRGEAPELGRDADTGGQVKYVLELARYLGEHPAVAQVDLITRLIQDKTVADIYSQKHALSLAFAHLTVGNIEGPTSRHNLFVGYPHALKIPELLLKASSKADHAKFCPQGLPDTGRLMSNPGRIGLHQYQSTYQTDILPTTGH